jgi:hypothetical protein
MVTFQSANLLYKATRDGYIRLIINSLFSQFLLLFKGFGSAQFHFKVSDTSNTVVIVKTNSNYVFGGYTRANWNAAAGYAGDFNAFLFTNVLIFSKRFNHVNKKLRNFTRY